MKLKVGDQVLVNTGKDRGKKGSIKQIYPKTQKILVEGINQVVKHRKPMMGKSGERIIREKPIDASKVTIINRSGEADRIGYTIMKDGTKTRIFKKTGELIDSVKEKRVKGK